MMRIADDFGGQQQPAPHPGAPAVAPQTPTGTAGTTITPGTTGTTIDSVEESPQAPSKGKRSFWWRLLGRGRDNKSPKDNPPPPPPKRPEGD